jgi:DNA-directed RNA polymerase specialized sigma24 family protein
MEQKQKHREGDLPAYVVKQISEVAAAKAIERYTQEEQERRARLKDRRLNNAKLLLRKYKLLKEYSRSAIYEANQIADESMIEIMDAMGMSSGEVRKIESIQRNVIVTNMIMEHVSVMLNVYEGLCRASKKPEARRRWRVIYGLFVANEAMSAQEIADTEHISVSMVYTDVDNACDELSSLFFGLDLSLL